MPKGMFCVVAYFILSQLVHIYGLSYIIYEFINLQIIYKFSNYILYKRKSSIVQAKVVLQLAEFIF